MVMAIIPDVDEQRCIGCALCVEIYTALVVRRSQSKTCRGLEER